MLRDTSQTHHPAIRRMTYRLRHGAWLALLLGLLAEPAVAGELRLEGTVLCRRADGRGTETPPLLVVPVQQPQQAQITHVETGYFVIDTHLGISLGRVLELHVLDGQRLVGSHSIDVPGWVPPIFGRFQHRLKGAVFTRETCEALRARLEPNARLRTSQATLDAIRGGRHPRYKPYDPPAGKSAAKTVFHGMAKTSGNTRPHGDPNVMAAPPPPTPPRFDSVILFGSVHDRDGAPVGGARVYIDGSRSTAQVQPGNGRWRIRLGGAARGEVLVVRVRDPHAGEVAAEVTVSSPLVSVPPLTLPGAPPR